MYHYMSLKLYCLVLTECTLSIVKLCVTNTHTNKNHLRLGPWKLSLCNCSDFNVYFAYTPRHGGWIWYSPVYFFTLNFAHTQFPHHCYHYILCTVKWLLFSNQFLSISQVYNNTLSFFVYFTTFFLSFVSIFNIEILL